MKQDFTAGSKYFSAARRYIIQHTGFSGIAGMRRLNVNKGGIQLTIISILIIAVSVGLAAALSALTPEDSLPVGPAGESSLSAQEEKEDEVSSSGEEEEMSGEESQENDSLPEGDSDEDSSQQESSSSQQGNSGIDAPTGGYPGGNEEAVVDGRLPGYEDQEINTNADAFNYLLNSGVTFDQPGGEGDIMVENTPGNMYPMQLQYRLTDTGELIYTSAMLKPGQSIQKDRLSVTLEEGFYDVTATLTVYDDQSMEAITTFSQDIVIRVKRKKFLGIF